MFLSHCSSRWKSSIKWSDAIAQNLHRASLHIDKNHWGQLELAAIVRNFGSLSRAWRCFIDQKYLQRSKYSDQLRWERLIKSKPHRFAICHPDENMNDANDVNTVANYKPYTRWILSIGYMVVIDPRGRTTVRVGSDHFFSRTCFCTYDHSSTLFKVICTLFSEISSVDMNTTVI